MILDNGLCNGFFSASYTVYLLAIFMNASNIKTNIFYCILLNLFHVFQSYCKEIFSGKMDKTQLLETYKSQRAQHNITYDLKKEQCSVILPALNGRNVVGLLPTGFGKTLCFVVPTMVKP
jgi:hypothetical protein